MWRKKIKWSGSFLEGPGNFSGPQSFFLVKYLKTEGCHGKPEPSCMKRTSVHLRIYVYHKVLDFAKALRVRELFGTFEKRAAGNELLSCGESDRLIVFAFNGKFHN